MWICSFVVMVVGQSGLNFGVWARRERDETFHFLKITCNSFIHVHVY